MNSALVKHDNGWVSLGMVPRDDKSLVKNMNGKTLGKTLKAHAEMPSREEVMYFAGEIIMQTRKNSTIKVMKVFKRF